MVATPDGAFIFIRSFTSPDLTFVDVDAQKVGTVTLPDIATDLEIEPAGNAAVAVLRATAQVAVIRIPQDLQAGGTPLRVSLGGFKAGQSPSLRSPHRGPGRSACSSPTPRLAWS